MTCDLLVARQCETRCESLGGYPIKTALHPRREGRTVDFAHHKPKGTGCQVPEPRSCRRRPVASTTAPSTARVRPTKPTAFHADRKSTRLNSSHVRISYAVFCLKKKNAT